MNWIAMDGMKELTKHPDMIVNRHKYFRWTRRTAFLTTMYVVVVPATLGYFGYITEVSCHKRGGCEERGDGANVGCRASGRCVGRGGETRSLSFRRKEGVRRRVYIIRQCRAARLRGRC